ncbi:predicted protein [Chaetomium globosum CBS 148.51]|uniref:Uncharacterized protein n=1 Tax=Chaetomium globosum (strain ATCC 6205 / CBS 148.51 / DSM 1962 / NBRC 6347 / NRRL 1970) TaxID=306901 RepID=Q2GNW2_CHAGB|nr:uncharacterized protein CHGG_10342 [Chaetomium globosum CBS 148.51]EAQ83938.1 predicted protein [Chaetomium globosum CBS 148.51]
MVRVTTGQPHHAVAIIEKRAPAVLLGRSLSVCFRGEPARMPASVSPGGAVEDCHWRKRRRSLAEDGKLAPHAARDRQATLGVRMVGGDGPSRSRLRGRVPRILDAAIPLMHGKSEDSVLPTRLVEPPPVPQDYARKFPASRINRNPLPLERPPQPAAMSLHWLPETFGWIQLAKGYEKRTQHCT